MGRAELRETLYVASEMWFQIFYNVYVISMYLIVLMCDYVYLQVSEKVGQILDIWQAGKGVVSLHIFQNVIPVEAYTREAAMVDAIGKLQ